MIKNLGQGEYHPFNYDFQMQIGAGDSWGNFTFPQNAENGQLFQYFKNTSGDELAYQGPGSSPSEIQLLNNLEQGSISANIYRSGNLLATKTSIAPGQKAVFSFKPTIWIGAVSQIEEGQIINSAIISDINTEISLLGIASADIIISGVGPGANATPFVFSLENIKYA